MAVCPTVISCPQDFKDYRNPWHHYALQLKYMDQEEIRYHMADWEWKNNHKPTQTRQLDCLLGILSTSNIKMKCDDVHAVAGLMLSEMLTTVPESPFKKMRESMM